MTLRHAVACGPSSQSRPAGLSERRQLSPPQRRRVQAQLVGRPFADRLPPASRHMSVKSSLRCSIGIHTKVLCSAQRISSDQLEHGGVEIAGC